MLYILILFLYTSVATYLSGKLLLKVFQINFGFIRASLSLSFLLGVVVLSTILVIISLLYPLNTNVHVFIMSGLLISVVWTYKDISSDFLRIKKITRFDLFLLLIFICLGIYIVVKCWGLTSHYDEGLYYIQNIKWLQQHGTVVGLANIHTRLGFNSNWHTISAFFDYPPLPTFFNDLNGWLFLICVIYSLLGLRDLYKKKFSLSSILKSTFLFPLLIQADGFFTIYSNIFINTISPDIPVALFSWISIITLIESYEQEETELQIFLEFVACIFAVYAITIKLSVLPIFFILLFVVLKYLYFKRYQLAMVVLMIAMFITAPWVCRNVLLSGYVVFPFSGIDLFNFEWKVTIDQVRGVSQIVKDWAKLGYNYGMLNELTFKEWTTIWHSSQLLINRGIFLYLIIIYCTYLIISIIFVFQKRFKQLCQNPAVFVTHCLMLIGIIFWFTNAPDVRFGYTFLIFPIILLFSLLVKNLLFDFQKWVPITFLLLYLLPITDTLSGSIKEFRQKLILLPQKYGSPILMKHTLKDGTILYTPKNGDQCFDSKLPCGVENDFNKSVVRRNTSDISKGFILLKK